MAFIHPLTRSLPSIGCTNDPYTLERFCRRVFARSDCRGQLFIPFHKTRVTVKRRRFSSMTPALKILRLSVRCFIGFWSRQSSATDENRFLLFFCRTRLSRCYTHLSPFPSWKIFLTHGLLYWPNSNVKNAVWTWRRRKQIQLIWTVGLGCPWPSSAATAYLSATHCERASAADKVAPFHALQGSQRTYRKICACLPFSCLETSPIARTPSGTSNHPILF